MFNFFYVNAQNISVIVIITFIPDFHIYPFQESFNAVVLRIVLGCFCLLQSPSCFVVIQGEIAIQADSVLQKSQCLIILQW